MGSAVLELVDDVTPLAAALAERGTTLIHGDLRDENIALPDGRLVLLDFGLATQGHPAVELAWYMVHDVWRIAATHDEVVDDFRHALGERDDPAALELGLISGLVQYGWIFGHSAVVHTDPAEREWARDGARLVGAARAARPRTVEVRWPATRSWRSRRSRTSSATIRARCA